MESVWDKIGAGRTEFEQKGKNLILEVKRTTELGKDKLKVLGSIWLLYAVTILG